MKDYTFIAFDTLCQIQIFGDLDQRRFHDLACQLEQSARRVESALSMYDSNSELSELCAAKTIDKWLPISELLHAFLIENKRMYEWTDGVFDPTVGQTVKLWDFLSEEPKLPDKDKLAKSLEHVGFDKILIDTYVPRVRFLAPIDAIDPGASGKGFALKQAVNILKESNIKSASLNYGGNIFVLGNKPSDDKESNDDVLVKWRIGIFDPNTPHVQHIEELYNEGISTSSWYEHGFELDEKVYHHIINPRTGYPVKPEFSSVSIISNDAFYTDLVSTPFFLLGKTKGEALLEKIRTDMNGVLSLRYVAL